MRLISRLHAILPWKGSSALSLSGKSPLPAPLSSPLWCERLEERRVLSVSAALVAGQLLIDGDGDADDVRIELQNAGTDLESIFIYDHGVLVPITIGGTDHESILTSDLTAGALKINLGGNDDLLALSVPTGLMTPLLNISVEGGDGIDHVTLYGNGADPAATNAALSVIAETTSFGDADFVLGTVDVHIQGSLIVDMHQSVTLEGDFHVTGDVHSPGLFNLSVSSTDHDITIDGQLGVIGSELGAVHLDAGTGHLTLHGAQLFDPLQLTAGQIDLEGDYSARSVHIDGELHINSDVVIKATGGDLDLSLAPITSDHVATDSLTLEASGDLLLGTVSDIDALSLTANRIVLGDSLSANSIDFQGHVELKQTLTISALDGSVDFHSSELSAGSANVSLTLSATENVILSRVSGLDGLDVTATSAIHFNQDVETKSDQSYHGAVVVQNTLKLTSTEGGVQFNQAVSGNAGTEIFMIEAAQDVTFADSVSGVAGIYVTANTIVLPEVSSVHSVGLTAANGITLTGDVITFGDQDYWGAVTISGDCVLQSGGGFVTFGSTVSGETGTENLSVTSGPGIRVQGTISQLGDVFLAAPDVELLTVSDVASIEVQGTVIFRGDVTTTGSQTYQQVAVVTGSRTLTSTGGDILIEAGLMGETGSETLTIESHGSYTVNFTSSGLQAYSITAETVSLAGLDSVGDLQITATDTITFGGDILADSIVLSGEVHLSQGIRMTAGTGGIDLTNASVIAGAPFSDLILVAATSVVMSSATDLGSLDIDAGTTITLLGDVSSWALQRYRNNVIIADSVTLTVDFDGITFEGTVVGVNSTESFTVHAGGAATFSDTLSNLGAVTLSADVVTLQGVNSVASLDVTGASGIHLQGDVSTSGNQNYHSAVTISGDRTLTSTTGDVSFDSTVQGETGTEAFNVDAHGAATFSDTLSNLGAVTLSADVVTLQSVNSMTSLDVTGASGINLQGDVSTSGNQNYHNAVTLSGDRTLTSTAGDVTFDSIVQGETGTEAFNVDTHGAATFSGEISQLGAVTLGGNTVSLQGVNSVASLDLTASSGIHLQGDVSTSGNQNYHNAVTLSGDRTLTSTAGDVTFDSIVQGETGTEAFNVDAHGAATFSDTLSNLGAVTLSADVVTLQGVNSVASLDVTGSSGINLQGDVTTSGNQNYHNAVTLSGDRTLTSTTGDVSFDSRVQGETGTEAFNVDAHGTATFSDTLSNLGAVTLSADVVTLQGVSSVASLDVTGASGINLQGDASTSGNQNYHNAVTLSGDRTLTSTAGDVSFDATVQGEAGTEAFNVDAHGTATFSDTLSNLGAVTLSADVVTLQSVNSTTSLDVTGASDINLQGDVSTSGNQNYHNAVTLSGDRTLTSTTGDVTFDATVQGEAGSENLQVSAMGTITLSDTLSHLSQVTLSGQTISLSTVIDVADLELLADSLTLNGDLTAGEFTLSGMVSFSSSLSLTSTSGKIDLSQASLAASGATTNLTLAAATQLLLASVTGVQQLDANAGTGIVLSGDVSTAGQQRYRTGVTLTGSHVLTSTAGTVRFDSSLQGSPGTENLTVTGADVTFTGGISTLTNLTVNASGQTLFASTVQLSGNLETDAKGTTTLGGNVSTAGNQQFRDSVLLENNITLTGHNITFDALLNSQSGERNSLTVNTTASGITTFNGAIGGVDRLSALTTNADGTTRIQGGLLQVHGSTVTFNDAVILLNDLIIDEAGPGAVTFAQTVDSAAGTHYSLSVTTNGGEVRFQGGVGATDSLQQLAAGGGTIRLSGGSITTVGQQQFHSTVIAGSNLTLTGQDTDADGEAIEFASTFNGDGHALTITGGGQFQGAATGISSFLADTIDTESTLTAQSVRVTGASELGGDLTATAGSVQLGTTAADHVSLTADVQVTASSAIEIAGNVSGPHSLVLQGTSSTIGGAVAAGVHDLTTLAGGLTAGSIHISGDLTAADHVATTSGSITVAGNLDARFGISSSQNISVSQTAQLGGVISSVGSQEYQGAVTLLNTTALSAAATGGGTVAIRFHSTINDDGNAGTSSSLTITTADTVQFNGAIGNSAAISSLLVNGGGTSELGGNVTSLGQIRFDHSVVLMSSVVIVSQNSDILFNGTVNSNTGAAHQLSLTAPSGTVQFSQGVGTAAGGALGALTVTAASQILAQSAVTVAGDIAFTGGAITFQGAVTTTNGGAVTLANSGLLTITAAADFLLDGAFAQTGTGNVSLAGDITTTSDPISFNAATTLTGSVALTTNGGNVTFHSTLNGTTAGAENLTLQAGAAGNVLFSGAVGQVRSLGAVTIQNAHNVTAQQAFTASTLTQQAGTGTTTFQSTLSTSGAGGIQLTGNAFTFQGAVTTNNGGAVTLANSGLLTIAAAADFLLDGAFAQTGTGNVSLAGDITTTGDPISFNAATTLTGSVALTTNGGNVTFHSTLNGTTAGAENLTLQAGAAGNVLFSGAVGQVRSLGAVTIQNAHNVTAQQAFTASTLTQQAGTGTTTFQSTLSTSGAGGIQLTGNAFTFQGAVTTNNGGAVTLANSGLLTIAAAADFLLDGAFAQTGTGNVSLAGDITTTGDPISFNAATTLTGSVALTTNGGNVTFHSTLNGTTAGAENLTLQAGAAGNVLFSGAVGQVRSLGAVTIQNAHNVTAQQAFTASTLTQQAGTGTTTLNGLVTTTAAGGVNLSTVHVVVNGGIDTRSGNGTIQLTASDDLIINSQLISDSAAITLWANDDVTITAAGAIRSTSGAVSVVADADNQQNGSGGAILMAATAVIDAGSGTIELSADENITLTGVRTTNATANAVRITSVSGGIVDGGETQLDLVANSAGAVVTIRAATGIGSATSLDTQIDTLDAVNSTSGNISLRESDSITVRQLIQGTGAGTIDLRTTNGSITVDHGGATAIRTNGSGTILLQANGASADLVVNSGIQGASASVNLSAGRNLVFGANGDVTSTAGDITLGADADLSGTGAITQDAGSLINAGSGRIQLSAAGDITLGGLRTTHAGDDAVQITSRQGAIVDGGDLVTNVDAANGQLTMTAATGIGSANAIETTVNRLRATNTTSGNIDIQETNALVIRSVTQQGNGNVRVATTNGALTVQSNDGGIESQTGSVTLIADGATSDITLNDDVVTHGGNVFLTAGRNLSSTVGNNITTTGAAGVASGNVQLTAQGTGRIELRGDIVTTGATNAAGGNVTISTNDGAVLLTNVTASGGAANGAAGNVTVTAGDADASRASDLTLTGGITALGGAVPGTDGTVSLSAGGNLIDGNDGQTLIRTGNLSLTAYGNIGNITDFESRTGNAIDAVVTGQLLNLSSTGTGSSLYLKVNGNLSAAAGSINPSPGAATLLIETTGNLDVGTLGNALVLTNGDRVGLHAGGTLVLPDVGVNVGNGQLRLTGTHDVIDPSGRDLGKLTADDLIFVSGSAGGSTTLNTHVREIQIDLAGAPSTAGVTVNEDDSLIARRVQTTNGNVRINTGLLAAGDLSIGQIKAGTGQVALDASNQGEILDADETQVNIIAQSLAIRAAEGISVSNPLEVQVSTLAATTQSGAIQVRNVTGGLTVGTVDGLSGVSITAGAATDAVTISTPGSLNINRNVTNNAGHVTLAADAAAGTLTVAAGQDVQAGGAGKVTLLAGNSLVLETGSRVLTNTGEIEARAGVLFNQGTGVTTGNTAASLLMRTDALIGSNSGNITVRAPADVELGRIDADRDLNNVRGNVVISADQNGVAGFVGNGAGEIRNVQANSLANVRAADLSLSAATGIGSTQALNLEVQTVTAVNAVSGKILLTQLAGAGDQALIVNGVTNKLGQIDIRTQDGTLSVQGPVQTTQGGTITLIAGDADNDGNGDLHINSTITSTQGNILLRSAGNDVTFNAQGDVTSQSGRIDVEAGATDGSGQILQSADAVLNAGQGQIRLNAHGQITLGRLITLSEDNAAVSLTTTGNINSANGSLLNITAAAGRLVIDSGAGVSPIRTTVGSLDLINRNSGSVTLIETDGLDIQRVDQQAAAPNDVTITTGGTLRVLSTGSGITATSGDVELRSQGATSDIQIQHALQTTTGTVRVIAGRDVLFSSQGSISTTSGSTLVIAGGDPNSPDTTTGKLVMADGATITSQTGRIDLRGETSVTVGRVVTGGDVRLTSRDGGIIDGGDTGGADVVAANLGIDAATGVGSGNALETAVSNLAVLNRLSGDVRIDNNVGGPLTIGSVNDGILPTLNGIINSGTGNGRILVNNVGALTVANAIANFSGGEVTLFAIADGGDDDHLTVSAPIFAGGANGHITLNAGTDLILLDTPVAYDLQGVSITGAAAREVLYQPGFVVKSSTGSVTSPTPLLQNVTTPQVLPTGIAVINGEFGRPGDNTFVFQITWDVNGPVMEVIDSGQMYRDAETGKLIGPAPGVGPGTFSFNHQYWANPDPANPANPIPITMTLYDDRNITFTAAGVDLGVVSVTSYADVPGTGIGFFFIYDLSIVVPPIEAPRVQIGTVSATTGSSVISFNVTHDIQTFTDSEVQHDERIVLIEKVGADGLVELDRNGLPIRRAVFGDEAQLILNDLSGLFHKLHEGRWRIFLKEGEDAQPQLVRDVLLRNGKPASEEAGTQDRPPTESNEMQPMAPPEGSALDWPVQVQPMGKVSEFSAPERAADLLALVEADFHQEQSVTADWLFRSEYAEQAGERPFLEESGRDRREISSAGAGVAR
ncbi:beta strand repeat-containing protein [Planctomicrobium sp. SH664]|uniref:beta strand repeat-containing protein n=1 Tax=Planctomicrobium sp. SH664 TaxID=3448125 RepID=UPI003F5B14C5